MLSEKAVSVKLKKYSTLGIYKVKKGKLNAELTVIINLI
jgi:hypothetical protein